MRISRGGTSHRGSEGNTESVKKQSASKWKAIKIVIFTTGAFTITWGPYLVSCVLYSLCKDRESCKPLAVLLASPLLMLGFLNSIINPFIYAWWHKPFRDNATRILLCRKKCSKSKYNVKTQKYTFNDSSLSSHAPTTLTDVEDERLWKLFILLMLLYCVSKIVCAYAFAVNNICQWFWLEIAFNLQISFGFSHLSSYLFIHKKLQVDMSNRKL